MRVLLLNQTFHPDVAATAQQASDLASKLVERGHDVTVVCGRRAYDNRDEQYPPTEIWRGVHIRRIGSFHLGKKARWRRAADFGSYLASCVLHLSGLPRFDLVIGMTSPPLISWLGALFTHVKGGRFVFWVMDLNPDEAVAAGWLRADSFTTKRLMGFLDYSLRQATIVVVLDRFMAGRIQAKGIEPEEIVVLPPWSSGDVVQYDEEGRERFRKEHGLEGKYVVMYSGNHSPCHPLTTLLEAARCLRDRTDVAFCFVGGGSEFQTVRRFAERHALANIVTLPYQPMNTVGRSLSAADLHVVVMGDGFVGIVHPCKVYNIRSLGIPYLYIGPPVSHVTELAPTFVAQHGDVDSVVRHIESGAGAAQSRVRYPETGVAHSRNHLLTKMAFVLENAAFGPSKQPEHAGASAPKLAGAPIAQTHKHLST